MEQMELSEREERQQQEKPKQATALLHQLMEDVRALNSAVSIIAEKMKHLTRNEKILGRNLIVLNKKIQSLKDAPSGDIPEDLQERLDQAAKSLLQLSDQVASMQGIVGQLQQQGISEAELKELKYVVEAINPLEYATLSQVKEMLDQRVGRKGI